MAYKHLFVYDLEVFPNFFSLSAINIDTQEQIVMYLYKKEQGTPLEDIYSWLKTHVLGLIGYNNINYDYPVLHQILLNEYKWSEGYTVEQITADIYKISKEIISEEYSAIPLWRTKIPQLDLYAIHHFDNPAKRTSLKDLEIAMRWGTVKDLPMGFEHIVQPNDIKEILLYNMNDVEATYEFYKKSEGEITLRRQLSKEYNINLINANDPKIGSEIFAKILSERKKIPIKTLRTYRTHRESIKIADLILPTVEFKTQKFKSLLGNIKQQVIVETKGSLKNTLVIKGFKYEFGVGGLHGCVEPGVYQSSKDFTICSCDVASLYPSIAINNGFYPEHLGRDFVNVYKEIRDRKSVV